MTSGYAHNVVQIILHPIVDSVVRLEVRPDTVNCRAAFEDLQFFVDWSKSGGSWLGVKVCQFADADDGKRIDTENEEDLEFRPSKPDYVGKLRFSGLVSKRKDCKYEIHYYRAVPPETIILDPTVILRPGDWVPETDP